MPEERNDRLARDSSPEEVDQESTRWALLQDLEDWLEGPVVFLGLVWLGLLVIELIWGTNQILEFLTYGIWAIFVLDFLIRLALAPRKLVFIKNNWLTIISLFVPALRFLRVFRFARYIQVVRGGRSLRLIKVVGSLNRGMRSLRSALSRRGFGYVTVFTVIAIFVGAAGMHTFEGSPTVENGFDNYGDALYFTAMLMTTLGSAYEPITVEGRVLSFLIALYAFAVFGYVTASLATYFIGKDAESQVAENTGHRDIKALQEDLEGIRDDLQIVIEEQRSKQEP